MLMLAKLFSADEPSMGKPRQCGLDSCLELLLRYKPSTEYGNLQAMLTELLVLTGHRPVKVTRDATSKRATVFHSKHQLRLFIFRVFVDLFRTRSCNHCIAFVNNQFTKQQTVDYPLQCSNVGIGCLPRLMKRTAATARRMGALRPRMRRIAKTMVLAAVQVTT